MRRYWWSSLVATSAVAAALLVAPGHAASTSCAPGAGSVHGDGRVSRTTLTTSQLLSPSPDAGLVDYSAFALPAHAAPASHTFNRSFQLRDVAHGAHFQVHVDTPGYADQRGAKQLPPISVGFTQACSYLIPWARGLQYTGDPHANLVVGVGRVWDEKGDRGWTRASFPFTLVERGANCTHNGVMTFLFNGKQSSPARYQVAAETCYYYRYDLWGSAPVDSPTATAPDSKTVAASFARELADRIPTRPLSAITTDHPGTGFDQRELGKGIPPADRTAYGLYYDGINYVSGCVSRTGPYPFCDEMLLPSYSTAKTLLPGMGLMLLAAELGPHIVDESVAPYLPASITKRSSSWAHVTFRNLADMASGNYRSSGWEADEDGQLQTAFLNAESSRDKLAYAYLYPHKAAPGMVWTYHTSDSFLLTIAESNLLQSRFQTTGDIWDHLVTKVLRPLHISPDSLVVERTDNSPSGYPLGGLGMLLTQDAAAKLARFLNGGGVINGHQVLSRSVLSAALQRSPSDRGMDLGGSKYHYDTWADRYGPKQGFRCSFLVPFMSGYGGITIAMLPNGSDYYYFSDSGQFNWSNIPKALDRLRPMCR